MTYIAGIILGYILVTIPFFHALDQKFSLIFSFQRCSGELCLIVLAFMSHWHMSELVLLVLCIACIWFHYAFI
jgi:hypothetical protein